LRPISPECVEALMALKITLPCCVLVIIPAHIIPVYAQNYEISPLFGGRFGGTLNLEQAGQPSLRVNIADSASFGVFGGFLFAGEDCTSCSLVGFRWMRQSTHFDLPQNVLVPPLASTPRPSVTLNNFLADFTHEWTVEEYKPAKTFLSGTLGAVHISGPASDITRFTVGIGTGVKIFPSARWGFQIRAEYLPIVLNVDLHRLVCGGAGCFVALHGSVVNQFQVVAGPVLRF
jgi:hypothetical protein